MRLYFSNKLKASFINHFSDRSGAALIMVIWVIALLGILVSEFAVSSRTSVKSTINYRDSAKSYYIAEAGLARTLNALSEGEFDKVFDQKKNLEGQGAAPRYIWRLNSETPAAPFGDGFYRVWVGNESGKVNLNQYNRNLQLFLFGCLGYDKEKQDAMSDCILDWIDNDSFHRNNGAETDYYSSLEKPYKAKDGYLTSLDEVLLVKGMTRELYFSSFFNELATVIPWPEALSDFNESADSTDKDDTIVIRKIHDYSRININAALPRLLSIMPGMNETLANNIVEYRKNKDITSLEEIRPIVGDDIFVAISPYLQVSSSDYYTIDIEAWCGDDFSGKQHIRVLAKIDYSYGSRKIKIINKIINPDLYRGFEYYAGKNVVRR